MVLADAGVACGLELGASDPWQPPVKPEFGASREPTIAAATFVDAFNTAHSAYRRTVEDGVIVIRPFRNNAAYLDAPSTVGRKTVRGVMQAAREIFGAINPTINPPNGGDIGSLIGQSPEQAGLMTSIVLDGYGRRTVDLLNDVVKQSPRGWYVIISDERHDPPAPPRLWPSVSSAITGRRQVSICEASGSAAGNARVEDRVSDPPS
jgi:hypothetical protein